MIRLLLTFPGEDLTHNPSAQLADVILESQGDRSFVVKKHQQRGPSRIALDAEQIAGMLTILAANDKNYHDVWNKKYNQQ